MRARCLAVFDVDGILLARPNSGSSSPLNVTGTRWGLATAQAHTRFEPLSKSQICQTGAQVRLFCPDRAQISALSGTLNPHLPYGRAKHTYEEELAANNAARASAAEHEGEPRRTRFHGVRLDDR